MMMMFEPFVPTLFRFLPFSSILLPGYASRPFPPFYKFYLPLSSVLITRSAFLSQNSLNFSGSLASASKLIFVGVCDPFCTAGRLDIRSCHAATCWNSVMSPPEKSSGEGEALARA